MSAGPNTLPVEGNYRGDDILADLREQAARIIKEDGGLSEDKAINLANLITDSVRANWSGLLIYFNKKNDLSERDLEIYNKYNTRNRDQLCKEYDLSVVRLYQIIKRVRSQEIDRRQLKIFEQDSGGK